MPYTIDNFNHSPHVVPDATETSAGMMSITDKIKLDSLTPGGFKFNVTAIQTSGYQALPNDFVRTDTSGGTFAVTLPPAAGNAGVMVAVKSVTATGVILDVFPQVGDTIEGSAGAFIGNGNGLTHVGTLFVSDGISNWNATGQYHA